MNLDFLKPRHLGCMPQYVLVQSISEYRHALRVLSRHPSPSSRHLQEQIRHTIGLFERELQRRAQEVAAPS